MSRETRRYASYLLRLWQTEREGEQAWQASLQSSRTGEQLGFSTLDALFAFLRQQTDTGCESHEGRGEGEQTSEREQA